MDGKPFKSQQLKLSQTKSRAKQSLMKRNRKKENIVPAESTMIAPVSLTFDEISSIQADDEFTQK